MTDKSDLPLIIEEPAETILLKPSKGWISLNLKDLWRFRELAFFLTWRDIKVRYKQTILGAAWAIIQPLLQMVVFTFLFIRMGQISTGDVPEELFSFAALLPWNLFQKALQDASRSLVSNRSMITKVYFPRMLVPFSTVLSGIVDFAIGFVILMLMMAYFGFPLTTAIWSVPLFLTMALITALGVGLWLSAINLHYRDVGYFLPFLTQLWMFITPIAYPLSEVTETLLGGSTQYLYLFYLNPMVAVVEGFRSTLLGTPFPGWDVIGIGVGMSIFILISGLFYFRRMERTFADMV